MRDRDLHLPDHRAPSAAAVVLHPHPGMGGDRHHPVVVAIADGLSAAGIAALRVDLRDPSPEPAAAALRTIVDELLTEVGTERLLLVGYSWGSIVTSLVGDPRLAGRVLIAPPVSVLVPAPGDGTPTLVLVPAHDQFGPPDAVNDLLGGWPATTIEIVEGADHFLAGAVQRVADHTVAWLTAGVADVA
jgi:alpha/beta superfamily hydrolase